MGIVLNTENIQDFSQKIRYSGLAKYLDKYFSFYSTNYPTIVNYFSGTTNSVEPTNFQILNSLIEESLLINNNIVINKAKLSVYFDWEMMEYFDDLKNNLITITKTSKFLRSSRTNSSFSDAIEFSYVLMQGQTLENVSKKVLGDNNFDSDWSDIALRNDLNELSYNRNSQNSLILSLNKKSSNLDIRSVIDNISGEKIYGRDINRIFTFANDDLQTLGYKDTVVQSVTILSSLVKGDHPEFFELGVSRFVGSNLNAFAYGLITRQLGETFSSDDTLVDLIVKKVVPNGSDITLEFSVSTRLDYVIENTARI